MLGNGEKNRTDVRRIARNVSCAIFFHQKHEWWVNLQVSCIGDVLILSGSNRSISSNSSSSSSSSNNRIFVKGNKRSSEKRAGKQNEYFSEN
jgi:hypothetical protein